MKLVICCHSFLFSEGLKKLLEEDPFVEEIRLATPKGLKKVLDKQCDLIIADLDTFLEHSEDVFKKAWSRVMVIYNTSQLPLLNGQLSELVSRGLVGVLPPETDSDLLKRAIGAVSSGELWINHRSLKDMIVSRQRKSNLTRQEGQIASFICRGYRNKEIAQKLDIAEQTVKSHCNRIYKKFGVSDRLQLALLLMSDKSFVKFEESVGRSGRN